MSAGLMKTRRKCFSAASWPSCVPGSVMATKFAPARATLPPLRPSVVCQKWRSNAWISMVPPDFEATMNSVLCRR